MRREGLLFERIVDPANFRLAFLKAARGKCDSPDVIEFRRCLAANVERIRWEVVRGIFVFGRGHSFKIHDPKERIIRAVCFEERIVHHAIMNVCEPVLDRTLIADTFACRKGKGRTAAVRRAQYFAAHARWVLKCDIRQYFDSIPHRHLLRLLGRRFKDPNLMRLFGEVLLGRSSDFGLGLPIGSLISQHFANFYLSLLDRWIKETLRRKGYVRYMDDFLVFGGSEADLLQVGRVIQEFVLEQLCLTVKRPDEVHDLTRGVDFLGYRLVRTGSEVGESGPRVCVRLARRSMTRFRRKTQALVQLLEEETLSESEFQSRSLALVEFTRCAAAVGFRRRVLGDMENETIGLAPCGPRRQLEQPRGELPVRDAELEPAGQPEQQPGFPSRPGPSSIPTGIPNGTGLDSSETEKPVLRRTPCRPGVSRSMDFDSNAPGRR